MENKMKKITRNWTYLEQPTVRVFYSSIVLRDT